jgi:hypothetical protein
LTRSFFRTLCVQVWLLTFQDFRVSYLDFKLGLKRPHIWSQLRWGVLGG